MKAVFEEQVKITSQVESVLLLAACFRLEEENRYGLNELLLLPFIKYHAGSMVSAGYQVSRKGSWKVLPTVKC